MKRANESNALPLFVGLALLLDAYVVATPTEISTRTTLPGTASEPSKIAGQLAAAQITRNGRRNRQVAAASPVGLLMDDPPPFPLEEFAGHDLVAPISPNGARPGDADGHRQGTGPDGEQHQEDADVAFLGSLETNVTASLGQSAFLRCRLSSAHQQVTWVRIRDWHILTSGLLTYTADARFRVKHATDAFEWTLEIKYLQKRDEGTYYCQIPTRTGTAVHAFHLHVASPQAVILGGHVSHVDIHTPSLTLVCIVDNKKNRFHSGCFAVRLNNDP